MTESEQTQLEAQKLALEERKQAFEELKYADDAASRTEQLAKLRADRKLSTRNYKELKTPYYWRPTFITALFQGIALVIAVVTALLNLGLLDVKQKRTEAELKAEQANLKSTTAELHKTDAERAQKNAEDKQHAAESSEESARESETTALRLAKEAEDRRKQADIQKTEAEKERTDAVAVARLGPVLQFLENSVSKDAYPVPSFRSLHPERWDGEADAQLALEALNDGDVDTRSSRIELLRRYAGGARTIESNGKLLEQKTGSRLMALRALFEFSHNSQYRKEIDPLALQDQLIDIARPLPNKAVDSKALDSLYDVIGVYLAAHTICKAYAEVEEIYDDERISLERYVWNTYVKNEKLFDVSPECAPLAWDWLSTERDGWRFAHPESFANLDASTGRWGIGSYSEDLSILMFSRIWPTANPTRSGYGQATLEFGPAPNRKTLIVPWSILDTNAAVFSGNFTDFVDHVKTWMVEQKDVLDKMNSPEMHALRGCDPSLLDKMHWGIPTRQAISDACSSKPSSKN